MACVYLIRSPEGRCYVGQSMRSALARFVEHAQAAMRGKRGPLYAAFRKYGPENMELIVLARHVSSETAKELEIDQIAFRETLLPNGYNQTSGGEGVTSPSRDSRERMGRPHRGVRAKGDSLQALKDWHAEMRRRWKEDPVYRAKMLAAGDCGRKRRYQVGD